MVNSNVRRLLFDIETSPNVVYSWQVGYKLNISHDNIVQERKVICMAYKWVGESKVTVLRWDDNQDDKAMLKKFLAVANEADEIIGHYIDGFDILWFRTRCLIHGLEPLPLYKTVDTKAWAAKYFYFNSNKLDYLGSILGYGHKLHTDFQLWIDVMNGSKRALDYMCRYCAKDIIQLEKVWNRLRFAVSPKTHAGVTGGHDKTSCAHCGSEDTRISKRRITAAGNVQWQYQCNSCGGYYSVTDAARKSHDKARTKNHSHS